MGRSVRRSVCVCVHDD